MTSGAQADLFGSMELETNSAADIVFQRSAKARNYRLTLRKDGTAVATIPQRGSQRGAEQFVAQHQEWLERERQRQSRRPRAAGPAWAGGPARASRPSAACCAAGCSPWCRGG